MDETSIESQSGVRKSSAVIIERLSRRSKERGRRVNV